MIVTAVFETGDEFLKGNPFKFETAFGKLMTIAIGDKIDELDVLRSEMEQRAVTSTDNPKG